MITKETEVRPKLDVLTPKQVRALPLLAAGKTGSEVAESIGANPATISNWLNHDVEFVKTLDQLRWESLRAAQIELQSISTEAVKQLRALMNDSKSDHVRLRAAVFVITAVGLQPGNDSYTQLASEKSLRLDSGSLDIVLEGLGIT